jgi:hypothetical protein
VLRVFLLHLFVDGLINEKCVWRRENKQKRPKEEVEKYISFQYKHNNTRAKKKFFGGEEMMRVSERRK